MLASPVATATSSNSLRLSFFSFDSSTTTHHHRPYHNSSPHLTKALLRQALATTTTSFPSCSSANNKDTTFLAAAAADGGDVCNSEFEDCENFESMSDNDEIVYEIENLGTNSRRIKSSIAINASLQTIWNLLTDYERLSDFIPSLSVSQLIQKSENFARLFQIGEQDLAFGLKFNAKGVVDCYERDLEILSFGQRRDIDFKMIEGDFQIFEGRWSLLQQYSNRKCESSELLTGQDYNTTLTYVVDVMPKMWLPVGLIEGRLCRDVKMNLSCIRQAALNV